MRISLKKSVFLAFLISGLLGIFFLIKSLQQRHSDKYWSDAWDLNSNKKFDTLPMNNGDIVFIGNSLTSEFPFTRFFFDLSNIRNRGIPYNLSRHVLARLESILNHAPGKIFLEIGINDLLQGHPADSIFQNYKKIIAIVKKADTRLYVQSILHTTGKFSNLNPDIRMLNYQIKAYCADQGVIFIDINRNMLQKDELDRSLTSDGIHLNSKGYQLWYNNIASFVREF